MAALNFPTSPVTNQIYTANGKSWTQTANGGEELLAWNEFESGGNIIITFDKLSD